MLRELYIENLAIIGRVRLELDAGLNVLTGETGAGKSILIDGLELVLGGRAQAEMVKSGQEQMVVEALFEVDAETSPRAVRELEELGLQPGELVVTRTVNRTGRSGCRINGRPATLATVRSLTGHLVDLHGQHEHQTLLDPSSHALFLDAFAGQLPLRQEVGKAYRLWREARSALHSLRERARERARQIDLLRFQVEEIDAARLRPGEEEELEEERRLLANAERLERAARTAYELLYGVSEGSAHDRVAEAAAALAEGARVDPRLEVQARRAEELLAGLDESARELAAYADQAHFDPERLAQVEARLGIIETLKRKYGDTIEEILRFRDRSAQEKESLQQAEERAEQLVREVTLREARLRELAAELSRRRQEAAGQLSQRVEAELRQLAMPAAVFVAQVSQGYDENGLPPGDPDDRAEGPVGEDGFDRVEFLFNANPGQDLRPLEKVASGGELSRVMLALKVALAEIDAIPTLVFDEIDAGVGGQTAAILGAKLAQVARFRQVLVVTHLAAVAAHARRHLVVDKVVADGQTEVAVRVLSDEEARVAELARMLGGAGLSPQAREHARRLRAESALVG